MSELSSEVRGVLERGLKLDGPSAARRERVKGKMLVALGGGVAVAGTVSSVGAAAPVVGAAAGVKGLLGSSLLVWFATGIGAGVSVGAVAAVVQHVQAASTVRPPLAAKARAPQPQPVAEPASEPPATPGASERRLSPVVDPPAHEGHAVPPPSGPQPVPAPAEPVAAATPAPMSVEASLLQRAQRALAANDATAALALVAEHEQRFPDGALAEERRVVKVLGLCELGRTQEAAILARAFVARSPNSVLVPRLASSCVGKVVTGP